MTNILLIPKIDGSQTTFAIATNADWLDQIFFPQPGYPASMTLTDCETTSGDSTVAVPDVTGVIPGMTVSAVAGIPASTFVGGVPTATTLTLADINGNAVNATLSNLGQILYLDPPPLDLTGITFIASLRRAPRSTRVFLTAQTMDGTIVNGGIDGTLRFKVPQSRVSQIAVGSYFLDILAQDSDYLVNLIPNGPASVTVYAGVSDIELLA